MTQKAPSHQSSSLIVYMLVTTNLRIETYSVFTRSNKHRANIELAQAGLLEPNPLAQM